MGPIFQTRADPATESQIPASGSHDDAVLRAIMARRLSSDFHSSANASGGQKSLTMTKEEEANNNYPDSNGTRLPALSSPAKKPPKTGFRRYIGIIMTFSASLNFSFGVLFAKLLQQYNYHGNAASFWRYLGVTVPAVPLLLYYELGFLCQPSNSHDDLEKGGGSSLSPSGPPSQASSQVSIIDSKEPLPSLPPRQRRVPKPYVSTFATVWPLTDKEKAVQAAYVFLRGTFAAVAVVLRYYALEYLPIGDTSVISYSTPVLVTILAHFMLGERAGLISFLVAFTTLVGVVIVAKPPVLTWAESFTSSTLIGTGFALASLSCASMQIVLTRKVRAVHFSLLTLTVGLIGLSIALGLSAYFQDFVYPTGVREGLYVAGLTGTSFLGQMSIILALKFEQAGPVALIRTSDVVIGFVLQYAFMAVVPEWTSVVGGLIVVSGVFVTGFRKFLQELPEEDERRHKFRVFLL